MSIGEEPPCLQPLYIIMLQAFSNQHPLNSTICSLQQDLIHSLSTLGRPPSPVEKTSFSREDPHSPEEKTLIVQRRRPSFSREDPHSPEEKTLILQRRRPHSPEEKTTFSRGEDPILQRTRPHSPEEKTTFSRGEDHIL